MSTDKDILGYHIRKAHALGGEHALAEYVAGLELAECARILEASPIELPALASKREECRVQPDERRGFEEVIRVWVLYVLSGEERG